MQFPKEENCGQTRQSKIKEEFPTIEDLMFRNKKAQKYAAKKKYYENRKGYDEITKDT